MTYCGPSGCPCWECIFRDKRESATQALIDRGYTRERALELLGYTGEVST